VLESDDEQTAGRCAMLAKERQSQILAVARTEGARE
jgi:hypothetical protein